MRKSLPKTPHSALSSRVAPLPAALLAVAGRRRAAAKANGRGRGNGAAPHRRGSAAVTEPALVEGTGALSARLRLLEGFLSRTQIADTAQHALQWLGDTLAVVQSVCLVRLHGEQSLSTVGYYGVPSGVASSFS